MESSQGTSHGLHTTDYSPFRSPGTASEISYVDLIDIFLHNKQMWKEFQFEPLPQNKKMEIRKKIAMKTLL